jgi:ATP-dependent Clp protease ATP-binding subunit ClpC
MLLSMATDEALNRLHHTYIGAEHLYIALTQSDGGITQSLLIQAGLDPRSARNEIRRDSGANDTAPETYYHDDLPFTPRAYRILCEAVTIADQYETEEHEGAVGEAHLLLAILREGEGIPVRKLRMLGAPIEGWVDTLETQLAFPNQPPEIGPGGTFGAVGPGSPEPAPFRIQRPAPSQTPLLEKYGRDLTALAKHGKLGKVIGREREIRAVARTLVRNKKNNPLLLGDAGVGKTAVVEGLALAIAEGNAPPPLQGRRIFQVEIGTLLAGTSLRGQFEERLVGILDEARTAPGIIIFIDEIHTIVGAGDTIDSNLDAANILKPALSRGELVCIGATTHEEYRKAIAQDAALDRRFRTIDIGEPTPEQTLTILTNVQSQYAMHHKAQIMPEALQAAVTLSGKYILNRYQPDKALDLLDEACARVVIHGDAARIVTAQTVAEVLADWTGIPLAEVTEDERNKYLRMEDDLRARVIGQDHAVQVVCRTIRANRAGLADPKRPVGALLFLGPSGVGKTELAKALAAFLFGSEDALLRLDMSEFHDEHTVARLIGAPPGYKDSGRGGQLTEALRRRPYSVVLLDEVEKAAPEVFDVFLQVFDDGRLTDARGATVDARHAVWIMTSNIGTGQANRPGVGFTSETRHTQNFQAALKKFFRPEFLDRLDDIVVFQPLTRETLLKVIELTLRDLYARLAEQGLTLQLSAEAIDLILTHGHDPANGARPLRRAVERLVTRPLSQHILEQALPPGMVICATPDGEGGLAFAPATDTPDSGL